MKNLKKQSTTANIRQIAKRPLKNVGQNIWNAIEVMEKEFGGYFTHDSHANKAYALRTLGLLDSGSSLTHQELWKEVMRLEGFNKQNNGQTAVVKALWDASKLA